MTIVANRAGPAVAGGPDGATHRSASGTREPHPAAGFGRRTVRRAGGTGPGSSSVDHDPAASPSTRVRRIRRCR
ncbi:hypothetical protein TOK_5203 [Pseudonocardia sp. N23]|nr:hypothetical protein TOK_5203 [Pseudonocardia sp. N23]